MIDEAVESGSPVSPVKIEKKKKEVDPKVAAIRVAKGPGNFLVKLSDYRDKRRLTNFFSLAEAKDLLPDFQFLAQPVGETATDEEITRAQVASLAIGLELATQLQEPRKILGPNEDGKAGFDEMERPFSEILKMSQDLKAKHPEIYLRELKRVAARRKGLPPDQVDQIPEGDAFFYEGNLVKSQNLIRHKAEALRAYSR
jgi:hypothetical protein